MKALYARLFPSKADEAAKVFPASTPEEAQQSRDRSRERPVHRLLDVEVARRAREDERQAGLPLSVRASASADRRGGRDAEPRGWRHARRQHAAAAAGARRGALGRDRVRDGQPRDEQGLQVERRGPEGLADDAGLLRELHQDGQPERRGAAELARRHAGRERSGAAHPDRRRHARRAGAAGAVPVPGFASSRRSSGVREVRGAVELRYGLGTLRVPRSRSLRAPHPRSPTGIHIGTDIYSGMPSRSRPRLARHAARAGRLHAPRHGRAAPHRARAERVGARPARRLQRQRRTALRPAPDRRRARPLDRRARRADARRPEHRLRGRGAARRAPARRAARERARRAPERAHAHRERTTRDRRRRADDAGAARRAHSPSCGPASARRSRRALEGWVDAAHSPTRRRRCCSKSARRQAQRDERRYAPDARQRRGA